MVLEQLLVLVQQGFTFRRVYDDKRNLGSEFDSRWETAPTCAYDAEFLKTSCHTRINLKNRQKSI
jgi:hypothetical protein